VLELGHALARKLRELRVRIDVPDSDTVVYRNVPANGRYFNKARTDLLLKRPAADMPFLVCVDEDLEYTGPDVRLSRVFRAGVRRDGWLALLPGGCLETDLHKATVDALSALGFDGQEPVVAATNPSTASGRPDGLLATYGTDLSQLVLDETIEPTVGRDEQIAEVTCCLMRWGQARTPVLVGVSGVGKTNLLYAVARALRWQQPALHLVRIDLARLFAGAPERGLGLARHGVRHRAHRVGRLHSLRDGAPGGSHRCRRQDPRHLIAPARTPVRCSTAFAATAHRAVGGTVTSPGRCSPAGTRRIRDAASSCRD
jgi:hypothetical protein